MTLIKVPPFEILPDGSKVYNLCSNAGDLDFIREYRLIKKAKAGDKEAQAQLDALEAEPTYWDTRFD